VAQDGIFEIQFDVRVVGVWCCFDLYVFFVLSIGDIMVSQSNSDLVWVGIGESNNR